MDNELEGKACFMDIHLNLCKDILDEVEQCVHVCLHGISCCFSVVLFFVVCFVFFIKSWFIWIPHNLFLLFLVLSTCIFPP